MKKFFVILPFIAIAPVILLMGCVSNEPPPVCKIGKSTVFDKLAEMQLIPQKESTVEMPMNSVDLADKDLINKLVVRKTVARRTATNSVQIITDVVNCTDYPQQLEARVQFYDREQVPSEHASAWKRIYLQPRASGVYEDFSTNPDASYFRVEMRGAR